MSKSIPPEKNREDEENQITEILSKNEKSLELLEVKHDKGAQTFIYRDPSLRKRESFLERLLRRK
jgi:hypothetical protein